MAEHLVFNLSVAFATVTGTAAGLLSLLTWRVFSRSPLGRVVFGLSITLWAFILYHGLLLAVQSEPFAAKALFSATYTALAVFVGLAVRTQRRLAARAGG